MCIDKKKSLSYAGAREFALDAFESFVMDKKRFGRLMKKYWLLEV